VNAKRYVELLPRLVQDWIATNCSESIGKDEWPPNLPDVNPLDCHIWGNMLEHYNYKTYQAKEHWWIEESLAVNMGPAGRRTQSSTSLKDFELVWKLGWIFRTYFVINITVLQQTLNIISDCSFLRRNFETRNELLWKAVSLETMKIFHSEFSTSVENF